MKIYKISQTQIQEPVKPVQPSNNPLDGKTNEQARKMIRNIVDSFTHKYYKDSYWEGPNSVFKALSQANIDWTLIDTQYGVSPSHQQTHTEMTYRIMNDFKEWKFTVRFINNKSKETVLNCIMTAHGVGSTTDPLDKYDMTVIVG